MCVTVCDAASTIKVTLSINAISIRDGFIASSSARKHRQKVHGGKKKGNMCSCKNLYREAWKWHEEWKITIGNPRVINCRRQDRYAITPAECMIVQLVFWRKTSESLRLRSCDRCAVIVLCEESVGRKNIPGIHYRNWSMYRVLHGRSP